MVGSKSHARWITASSGGNACRHRSGVAISPATGLAPRLTALAAERSERARGTPPWPRPTNARTTGAPIEPVPPRTRTRICFPLAQVDPAHVDADRRRHRLDDGELADLAGYGSISKDGCPRHALRLCSGCALGWRENYSVVGPAI